MNIEFIDSKIHFELEIVKHIVAEFKVFEVDKHLFKQVARLFNCKVDTVENSYKEYYTIKITGKTSASICDTFSDLTRHYLLIEEKIKDKKKLINKQFNYYVQGDKCNV